MTPDDLLNINILNFFIEAPFEKILLLVFVLLIFMGRQIYQNNSQTKAQKELTDAVNNLTLMLSEGKQIHIERDKKYILYFEQMQKELSSLRKEFDNLKDKIIHELNDLKIESAQYHFLHANAKGLFDGENKKE